MKEKNILFLVSLIILMGVIGGFLFIQNRQKISQKAVSCDDFTSNEREVSCQEARDLVLERYPGDVLGIRTASIPFIQSKGEQGEIEYRDAWGIMIKLNNPVTPDSPIQILPPPGPSFEEGVTKNTNTNSILPFDMAEIFVDKMGKRILQVTPL